MILCSRPSWRCACNISSSFHFRRPHHVSDEPSWIASCRSPGNFLSCEWWSRRTSVHALICCFISGSTFTLLFLRRSIHLLQVNKTLVLAVISSDSSKPHYVTIDWLRAQGAEDEEEILCSNSFLSGRTVRLQ